MKFVGIVMLVVMSFCGVLQAKEKDRKPSQTGNYGKNVDPKSAATFQCLKETTTYIEDTPVLKDYRRILMKKMSSGDKVEKQQAQEAWQKMDDAIIELKLNPCEIVVDEKFPR